MPPQYCGDEPNDLPERNWLRPNGHKWRIIFHTLGHFGDYRRPSRPLDRSSSSWSPLLLLRLAPLNRYGTQCDELCTGQIQFESIESARQLTFMGASRRCHPNKQQLCLLARSVRLSLISTRMMTSRRSRDRTAEIVCAFPPAAIAAVKWSV